MSSAYAAAMPLTPKAGGARRRLLLSLGCVCVALGLAGIVVPGLPTTVFLLAASWLFARSSPRLHRRLLDSPRLGPYLRMAQTGVMPVRAIVVSLVAMWAGIAFATLVPAAGNHVLQAVLLALGLTGSAAIGAVAWRSRHSASRAASRSRAQRARVSATSGWSTPQAFSRMASARSSMRDASPRSPISPRNADRSSSASATCG